MTFAEMAQSLGCSKTRAEYLTKCAMAKFKERLQERGFNIAHLIEVNKD